MVYWHEDVLLHDAGMRIDEPRLPFPEAHPESPERLLNIRHLLEAGPLASEVRWCEGRSAELPELERFHSADLVERVRSYQDLEDRVRIDRYSSVSAGTWQASLAAAGTAIDAAASVVQGKGKLAYALVRPAGHHSSARTAEGYCVFNNIGIAVEAARAAGVERVAIVDWDAHHGNGAQSFYYDCRDVLTISIHMHTGPSRIDRSGGDGRPEEVGRGHARGTNINVDLPWGVGDRGYAEALDHIVLPALQAFEPDLFVGGMAQDASAADPNGRMCLTMNGFHAIGEKLGMVARDVAEGRIVLIQEGGYAPSYTPLCAYATLAGFLTRPLTIEDPVNYLPAEGETDCRAALARSGVALAQLTAYTKALGRG